MLRPFLAGLVGIGLLIAAARGEGQPPPGTAVLEKMVGTWDEVVQLPDGAEAKGTTTVRWILGNSAVESESELPLPGGRKVQHLSVSKWDEKAGVYREWMFSPQGNPVVFTSRWDESQQALVAKSDPTANGGTIETFTKFVGDGRMEWTVTATDKEGKIAFKITGVSTRRKE